MHALKVVHVFKIMVFLRNFLYWFHIGFVFSEKMDDWEPSIDGDWKGYMVCTTKIGRYVVFCSLTYIDDWLTLGFLRGVVIPLMFPKVPQSSQTESLGFFPGTPPPLFHTPLRTLQLKDVNLNLSNLHILALNHKKIHSQTHMFDSHGPGMQTYFAYEPIKKSNWEMVM